MLYPGVDEFWHTGVGWNVTFPDKLVSNGQGPLLYFSKMEVLFDSLKGWKDMFTKPTV